MPITKQDILPMDVYAAQRQSIRTCMLPLKKVRRIAIGPCATLFFENYDTMWYQIHEMLLTEKGGEDQISDELAAYNPLIPGGDNLKATLMFEVENPVERLAFLRSIVHVEQHIFLQVDAQVIRAQPIDAQERTRPSDGKTSAVHFLTFPFLSAQKNLLLERTDLPVMVGIDHPEYTHKAGCPVPLRDAFKADLSINSFKANVRQGHI